MSVTPCGGSIAPRLLSIGTLNGTNTHSLDSLHLSVLGRLQKLLLCLTFGFSVGGGGRCDLTGDLLAVRGSDRKHTSCAHLNTLIFSCVKDFEDVLAQLVTWTLLHRSSLEQHLDISELSEVEVSLFIESVVLELELLHGRL